MYDFNNLNNEKGNQIKMGTIHAPHDSSEDSSRRVTSSVKNQKL